MPPTKAKMRRSTTASAHFAANFCIPMSIMKILSTSGYNIATLQVYLSSWTVSQNRLWIWVQAVMFMTGQRFPPAISFPSDDKASSQHDSLGNACSALQFRFQSPQTRPDPRAPPITRPCACLEGQSRGWPPHRL